MSSLELMQRRIERERSARRAAESLLEQKSRELYLANENLQQLADELRNQAEHTRAIVETAAEGIISYGEDGIIQSFNQSAGHIFRCKSAVGVELTHLFDAKDFKVLFPENTDSTVVDINKDETDLREPIEIVGRRASGKSFFAEVAISRITRGNSVLFTALVRDLSRRKKLEARLGQAQKMESVGQLAAGIAHEINTPIQFVGDNIQFLEGAFGDLGELLNLYEELLNTVAKDEKHSAIVQKIEEQSEVVDLPFLRAEFPSAISQATEGIDRVSRIVRAMKEFSQPTSEAKSAYDLNKSIDNTCAILANQCRDIAKIELALDSELSPLLCLAGQMNQSLLNIVSNSVEALEGQCEAGQGVITVSTKRVNGGVELRIHDNGPGIPSEIQDRIFDPFFTTKEVGKGMGQGLAFVYDVIVDKHEGSINVLSSPEEGTTFVVHLPDALAEQKRGVAEHANSIG